MRESQRGERIESTPNSSPVHNRPQNTSNCRDREREREMFKHLVDRNTHTHRPVLVRGRKEGETVRDGVVGTRGGIWRHKW